MHFVHTCTLIVEYATCLYSLLIKQHASWLYSMDSEHALRIVIVQAVHCSLTVQHALRSNNIYADQAAGNYRLVAMCVHVLYYITHAGRCIAISTTMTQMQCMNNHTPGNVSNSCITMVACKKVNRPHLTATHVENTATATATMKAPAVTQHTATVT